MQQFELPSDSKKVVALSFTTLTAQFQQRKAEMGVNAQIVMRIWLRSQKTRGVRGFEGPQTLLKKEDLSLNRFPPTTPLSQDRGRLVVGRSRDWLFYLQAPKK